MNLVEPFCGSLAVLLARPTPFTGSETVNDADGFIANFWRALAANPDAVAHFADWPVNENDLHARHSWLVTLRPSFTARLEGDPDYYDAKVAGWWVWGLCCWIGGGWCSGDGPWQSVDGQLVTQDSPIGAGTKRQLVHLGSTGQGVHRQRVHLGSTGQGDPGTGEQDLVAWMQALADRLRRVRVCCGDWTRVCGPTPTTQHGLTAVLLDPPYSGDERDGDIYAIDSGTVAADVLAWAIDHGSDPELRIALCGYDTEHAMPDDWTSEAWQAAGGYGSRGAGRGRANAARETVWFSPHCVPPRQQELWFG